MRVLLGLLYDESAYLLAHKRLLLIMRNLNYQEKTKQAALAKNSAAGVTYMTSTKTCTGTPTTAVESLLPRDLTG